MEAVLENTIETQLSNLEAKQQDIRESLAKEKVANWNRLQPKANAQISGISANKFVYIDFNFYGKRIRKPFSVAHRRDNNQAYLKKHKGKVVGKAIF